MVIRKYIANHFYGWRYEKGYGIIKKPKINIRELNMYYFNQVIDGWESWAKVFCSVDAFKELARSIFRKEGLSVKEDIRNLTPGTNAVFRADSYVIKIFVPRESGLDTEYDFKAELSVMEHIGKKGIAAPGIVTKGELKDKYLFRYIIMEYIEGKDAGDVLPDYNPAQKKEAVKQLKKLLKNLNQPADDLPIKRDLKMQTIYNSRLNGLNQKLIKDLEDCVNGQDLNSCVLVHGDITGENVLVQSNGEVRLIDFADCTLAPEYYELAPIIFELFKGDKEYVNEFIGEQNKEEFLNQLMNGLALHDFCGNLIKDYLTRLNIPYNQIKDLQELRQIIKNNIL